MSRSTGSSIPPVSDEHHGLHAPSPPSTDTGALNQQIIGESTLHTRSFGKKEALRYSDEATGSRELAVELFNASRSDIELIDHLFVNGKTSQDVSRITVEKGKKFQGKNGKTTQRVSRITVKQGEIVSWKVRKVIWALKGTQIYTVFKLRATFSFIFLGNECPLAGLAKTWSNVYVDSAMKGDL